jgi:hypothetical protein
MEAPTQQQSSTRQDLSSAGGQLADNARSMLQDQQRSAASGLGDFAGALRRAARESGGNGSPASRIAEGAADRLQRVSDSLRNKDLDSLLRDAESFARQQPAVFIGAAALVGFLAVRFLKSSSQTDDRTY